MVIVGIAAGGLGAACRLLGGGWVQRRAGSRFPVGTIAVNLLGALAAGIVAGALAPDSSLRIVGLGFLGGFTTFSTWMVETLALGEEHGNRAAALATALMVLAGVAACAIGYALTD